MTKASLRVFVYSLVVVTIILSPLHHEACAEEYVREGHVKVCDGFECISYEVAPWDPSLPIELWQPGAAYHDPLKGQCPYKSNWAWIPTPSEGGHLVAARLTPVDYPMKVYTIHYPLLQGTTFQYAGAQLKQFSCNANLAHRVEVYVGTATAPSNSPSGSTANPHLVDTITVPVPTVPFTSDRDVVVNLNTPIELQSGEYLFVAVEMQGTTSRSGFESMCLPGCILSSPSINMSVSTPQTNYWSFATNEPYAWQNFSTNYADSLIRAEGEVRLYPELIP